MNNLSARNCPNCGAPIQVGKYHCEWCGTSFKRDDAAQTFVIEKNTRGVRCLETRVAIPRYAYIGTDAEAVSEYTIDQMKHQIADALTGLIRIETCDDYMRDERIFRGTVRVLEPDFRF